MKYVLLFVIILMNISCSESLDENILQNLISVNITNTGNTPVLVGNKINFKAIGIFKNNSEKDITNEIKWISSKTNIGTIDEKGIFTARNSGTTEIYTQYKDIESNSILIRVISEEGLNKIEISIKENPSVLYVGNSYQAIATGYFGNGQKVDMTESVIWNSSDEDIMKVSSTLGFGGRVEVFEVGNITLFSSVNGIQSNPLVLISKNKTLKSITISLEKSEGLVDELIKVNVIGRYSNGEEKNMFDIIDFTFSSEEEGIFTQNGEVYFKNSGFYEFYTIFDGIKSNKVNIQISERESSLQRIVLVSSVEGNIFEGDLINLKVNAVYSDHNEDISGIITWKMNPDLEENYIIDENAYLMFFESGIYNLKATYKTDGNIYETNVVTYNISKLQTIVKPINGDIVINELLIAPPAEISGDSNGDGMRSSSEDEFIEIVNISNKDLDMSNLTITDLNKTIFIFPPNTVLRSHKTIVIFGGGNPTGIFGDANIYISENGISLNNNGDVISIKDENNITIYEVTYNDSFLQTLGSAVLFPELNTTKTYLNHKTVCTQLGCNNLFSPGTKADGTNFY